MANKNIGDKTEKLLLDVLQKHKYWCHLFSYNINGQPCDVVALKYQNNMLIDVKHCSGDRFEFRRVEPNQRNCFEYASSLGITCGFAIYHEKSKKFYWFDYLLLCRLEEKYKNTKSFYIPALTEFEIYLDNEEWKGF